MNNEDTQMPDGAESIGVVNPYALTELVLGRELNWNGVENHEYVFEETLGQPYDELFDPQDGSPLYPGVEVQSDGSVQWTEVDISETVEDIRSDTDLDIADIETLSDIKNRFEVDDFSDLDLTNVERLSPERLQIEVSMTDQDRSPLSALPKEVVDLIANTRAVAVTTTSDDLSVEAEAGTDDWQPTGVSWQDAGDFLQEATEFDDPVQGALGDCYFIAALSAVGWSQPFEIKERDRPLYGENDPVQMIEFFEGRTSHRIEVTENVPMRSNKFIYARSRDKGESWPAVYEKAYAVWKTGVSGKSDKPHYPSIAGGNMVRASAELTGGKEHYYATKNHSGEHLWNRVRGNSRGGKTFNPLTAWTYASAAQAPDPISYTGSNLVANHAYAVLGWSYDRNTEKKHLVLLNPWGRTEPKSDITTYNFLRANVPKGYFWRSEELAPNDGLFAMEANQFKRYFAGLGVVT